jgi:hypothetical protein
MIRDELQSAVAYLEAFALEFDGTYHSKNEVMVGKLIVPNLDESFLTFYGTQRFITVFITAPHWSLSLAK